MQQADHRERDQHDEGDRDQSHVGLASGVLGVEVLIHENYASDAESVRSGGERKEAGDPAVVLLADPSVVPGVSEVQKNHHLDHEEKAGTEARERRVDLHGLVREEEGDDLEQGPRDDLEEPAARVEIRPRLALVLDANKKHGEEREEQKVPEAYAVHGLLPEPVVRRLQAYPGYPRYLLHQGLRVVPHHPAQEDREREEYHVREPRDRGEPFTQDLQAEQAQVAAHEPRQALAMLKGALISPPMVVLRYLPCSLSWFFGRLSVSHTRRVAGPPSRFPM